MIGILSKDKFLLSRLSIKPDSAQGQGSSVYIIDLIDGEFPNSSSIESFQNGEIHLLEEERRLFYVGMTRAKRHLNLITMNSMHDKAKEASRFLLELQKK